MATYDPSIQMGGEQQAAGGYRLEDFPEMTSRLGLGSLAEHQTGIPDYSLLQHMQAHQLRPDVTNKPNATFADLFPSMGQNASGDWDRIAAAQQAGFLRTFDPSTGQWVEGDAAYGGQLAPGFGTG